MLRIGELSKETGVPSKTIRYYEEIGLLPPARRADNGYRVYEKADIERLTFIKSARALDFALDDIDEILAFKERNEPPCYYVMELMQRKIEQIEARIHELEALRVELKRLYQSGLQMPEDVEMKNCVCHLIEQKETGSNDN